MATVRQYDGDNAIERWRHCDDTTATVRYDYRIVAPRCVQYDSVVCLRCIYTGSKLAYSPIGLNHLLEQEMACAIALLRLQVCEQILVNA
ncbi:hypothetical protein DPMN_125524 [Dreissena polymorpha]|uniref:Uncharacterized protein n=1 Tax=Dreissena polymorpha TaxID=45954 RepID=A0A9D4GXQ4_DREPO|nr:hypothetical protein DPMN_125524 [Dreissena polymorpha]